MAENNGNSGRAAKIVMLVGGILLFAAAIALLTSGIDLPKWLIMGMFIIGIAIFFGAFMVGAPHREARRYVKENGDFDMDTPRSYEPMQVTWMQNFIGLGVPPLKGNLIQRFDYADGRVRIEMANGKVLDAPLSEIEIIVRKNPKGEGATGYELRHGDIKIFPLQNTSAFEETEVEDMWNILYRCKAVREPKSLKILSVANKIIGAAGDATSDSSPVDSFMEKKVTAIGKGAASDTAILGNDAEAVQRASSVPTHPKKRRRFIRVLLWIVGILAALFIALIIIGICVDDDSEPGHAGSVAAVEESSSSEESSEAAPAFDYSWTGGPFSLNGVTYSESPDFKKYSVADHEDMGIEFTLYYNFVADGQMPVIVMKDQYMTIPLTLHVPAAYENDGTIRYVSDVIPDPAGDYAIGLMLYDDGYGHPAWNAQYSVFDADNLDSPRITTDVYLDPAE